MFVYGILESEIAWDPLKILTVIFMLIGGIAVFTGLFMIYAGLCFFTLDGLEFMNIFTDGAREFGKYPMGVYGKKILLFSIFIVPYAMDPILPVPLSSGTEGFGLVRGPAAWGVLVFDSPPGFYGGRG